MYTGDLSPAFHQGSKRMKAPKAVDSDIDTLYPLLSNHPLSTPPPRFCLPHPSSRIWPEYSVSVPTDIDILGAEVRLWQKLVSPTLSGIQNSPPFPSPLFLIESHMYCIHLPIPVVYSKYLQMEVWVTIYIYAHSYRADTHKYNTHITVRYIDIIYLEA